MDPKPSNETQEEIPKIQPKVQNEEVPENQKQKIHSDPQKKQQQMAKKKEEPQNEDKKQEKKEDKEQEKMNQRPESVRQGKQELLITKDILNIKQSQIQIKITEYGEKGFALAKQYVFHLEGKDTHGPIQIIRSNTQFESLRKILLQRWPGCFIPYLIDKSDIKTQDMKIWYKKKCYENFIKKLGKSTFLYYKEEVQLFLRSPDVNITEMVNKMPVLRIKDVVDRFQSCFDEEIASSSPQNATKITNFSTSLKKVVASLGDLSKKSLKLAQSYDQYASQMSKLNKIFQIYEKNLLFEYVKSEVSQTVTLKDETDRMEKLAKLNEKNIFYEFYILFESESRDAEALMDIIAALEVFNIKRDELQKKAKEKRIEIDQIYLGHKSLKLMTTRKTKQQVQAELQNQEKELLNEKHLIHELYSIIEVVLSQKTIPIFKTIKYEEYYKIIQQWIEVTGSINPEIEVLWKGLNEESTSLLSNV